MTEKVGVKIIGAGPAGLSAARELVRDNRFFVEVLEQSSFVGGISRTELYNGYRIDIGGHRFFTKNESINRLWAETLGSDFLHVKRSSRIYYKGRLFRYPLQLGDTFLHLGPIESVLVLLSYLKALLLPTREEKTFEQWTINRFGNRLYKMFFKGYTEKVWGRPCSAIQADWAAQRIKGLSFYKAVTNAVFGSNGPKSLIDSFHYPRLGPGMMWDRFQTDILDHGGLVQLNSAVNALHHTNGMIQRVTCHKDGGNVNLEVDQVISTMPLNRLVHLLTPSPPDAIIRAANNLLYRDFIIVVLILKQKSIFPDQWLYIHAPEVLVGRIQNFKNWSKDMVPNDQTTCLGMEYFCDRDDEIWQRQDKDLIDLAAGELERLSIADHTNVIDACVIRQAHAYPVYDDAYRQSLDLIRDYLKSFSNLQTIGRNGMHRYNNMDHSMLTGIQAAQNLQGAKHDLWFTGVDDEYLEEHRDLKN